MTEKINTQEIIQKEKDYVLQTYPRLPFVITKGEGAYLYDSDGNEYLDFGTGIAVNAFGHCDAELVSTIQAQCQQLSHVSNLYHTAAQAELAEKLCQSSFANKVFFCNSGAEAIEAGLKFSRKYALTKFGIGKTKFVSFSGGFHGRTFGALSITHREKYQASFRPLLANIDLVKFNDVAAAEKAIDDETCAVILEVVQGEGGINLASDQFVNSIREACTRHNALLILDEVQSGFGRTGKLWAYQHYGIKPDIITLAKAMGGGLPIGATLLTETVAETIEAGDHGSTFGAGPIVSSTAIKVLDRIRDQELLTHVQEMGNYLHQKLETLNFPQIIEIRSLGLMVGISLSVAASPLYEKAPAYGILILTAGPNVIRLLPPLTITKPQIDEFIKSFSELLRE